MILVSLKVMVLELLATDQLASRVALSTISSKSMELEVALVSVPQENLPVVVSQRSLEVVAVSQSVRPEPLTPP